jgi:hypothetical protein
VYWIYEQNGTLLSSADMSLTGAGADQGRRNQIEKGDQNNPKF